MGTRIHPMEFRARSILLIPNQPNPDQYRTRVWNDPRVWDPRVSSDPQTSDIGFSDIDTYKSSTHPHVHIMSKVRDWEGPHCNACTRAAVGLT